VGAQLGPREGAGLGLGVRQQLMRQVPGAGTALRPGPGLRSALSRVPESALTGVPALAPTRVAGLALALTGVAGLPGLGLRLWLGGPRAGRAATRRCARTLAPPSRPVISHDPAYPPDDSLSAFT